MKSEMKSEMKTIVIKIGGRSVENQESLDLLLQEIKKISEIKHITAGKTKNYQAILVHGGGAAVSAIQKQYGIEPVFKEGLRMTSPIEMDIVDMGLSGKMNTYLNRRCHLNGINSVGLSGVDGSLFKATSISGNSSVNRTGKITDVDTTLPSLLLKQNYFPVISSVSFDAEGNGMNINADEAALAIASSLKAFALIFISDIPGVLVDDKVEHELNQKKIESLIKTEKITGGMIPKVNSSLASLENGVENVVISNYTTSGDLEAMLNFEKGTRIK